MWLLHCVEGRFCCFLVGAVCVSWDNRFLVTKPENTRLFISKIEIYVHLLTGLFGHRILWVSWVFALKSRDEPNNAKRYAKRRIYAKIQLAT